MLVMDATSGDMTCIASHYASHKGETLEGDCQSEFTSYFCEEFINYLLSEWLGHLVVIETKSGLKVSGVLVGVSPSGEIGVKHCVIYSPLSQHGRGPIKKNVLKGNLCHIRSISRAQPVVSMLETSDYDFSNISSPLSEGLLDCDLYEEDSLSSGTRNLSVSRYNGTMIDPIKITNFPNLTTDVTSSLNMSKKTSRDSCDSKVWPNGSLSTSRGNHQQHNERMVDSIPRFRRNMSSLLPKSSNSQETRGECKSSRNKDISPSHNQNSSNSSSNNGDNSPHSSDASAATSTSTTPLSTTNLPYPFVYPYCIPMPYPNVPCWPYPSPVICSPYHMYPSSSFNFSPSIMNNYETSYLNTVGNYYPFTPSLLSPPLFQGNNFSPFHFYQPNGMTPDQAFLYNLATALLLYNMYQSLSVTSQSDVTLQSANRVSVNYGFSAKNDTKSSDVSATPTTESQVKHQESTQTS